MMFSKRFWPNTALLSVCSLALLSSCIHKKYDTPITKNTQQPDKILFDSAMKDIEHGRYEVARISLQTLMNTYESSEFMAKAKLAIADSWYREGGANGLAQAEAEYKDFELFYPQMEESAEAQNRICQIHFNQMDKSDRDNTQALRAQEECRTLLNQYPNSKFAPGAAQKVRAIQESLAEHEFVVGDFYWHREMNPAAANRLNAAVDQFPLYSKADEALYEAGDAYSKMGPRFRNKAGEMFTRIVRDYPLGNRVDDAKQRLSELEMPIPQADRAAYDRMKYDQDNYKRPSMLSRSMGWMSSHPDLSHAARNGNPTMTDPKPTIPVSVPLATADTNAGGTAGGPGSSDVTVSQPTGSSALENKPDARSSGGQPTPKSDQAAATGTPAGNQALPTNRDKELNQLREKQAKQQQKLKKKKGKSKDQNQQTTPAPASTTDPAAAPASTTPANPPAQANPTTPPPQQ